MLAPLLELLASTSGFLPTGAGGGGSGLSGSTQRVTGAPQNAITFSGIPSTVQHLLAIGDIGTNRAGQAAGFVSIQFNGDTAAHYFEERISAQNAVITSLNSNANTSVLIDTTGGLGSANDLVNPFVCFMPNIQGANLNSFRKLFLWDVNDTGGTTATGMFLKGGFWNPPVAGTPITSVSFDANFPGSGQLIVGSMISLYQFS